MIQIYSRRFLKKKITPGYANLHSKLRVPQHSSISTSNLLLIPVKTHLPKCSISHHQQRRNPRVNLNRENCRLHPVPPGILTTYLSTPQCLCADVNNTSTLDSNYLYSCSVYPIPINSTSTTNKVDMVGVWIGPVGVLNVEQ